MKYKPPIVTLVVGVVLTVSVGLAWHNSQPTPPAPARAKASLEKTPESRGESNPQTTQPAQSAARDGKAAAAPENGGERMPAASDKLLRRAIEAIARHASVSANLRLKIDAFDQTLIGAGTYLQGPADSHRVRMEIKILAGATSLSCQQVCDGRFLWIHRELGQFRTLDRVDLERLLGKPATENALPFAAAANADAAPGLNLVGPGGIAQLLNSLARNLVFRALPASRLGDVPVDVLHGEWSRAALVQLLPAQKGAIEAGQQADLSKLPEQAPDHVVVWLGQDDQFPYRVDFRRHVKRRPAFRKTEEKLQTMVSMEFLEVQFDAPVKADWFEFIPGELEVTDATERYRGLLGRVGD